MANEMLLAALVQQARDEGAAMTTLRGLVEEASALGAHRALEALGLADEHADRDVRELRGLLKAWRDVRSSALKALAGWLARMLLALLVLGLTVRLGAWGLGPWGRGA